MHFAIHIVPREEVVRWNEGGAASIFTVKLCGTLKKKRIHLKKGKVLDVGSISIRLLFSGTFSR